MAKKKDDVVRDAKGKIIIRAGEKFTRVKGEKYRIVKDYKYLDKETGELKDEMSLTKQADKERCDINNIVKRLVKAGVQLPKVEYDGEKVVDISGFDYNESLNKVIAARDKFMALPASLRRQFDNDPAKFLNFVTDPKNSDKIVELGLAKPRKKDPPKPTSETPPESPKT